jgi:hypothetical protein
MSKSKLAVKIGNVRPNRFAGHAAGWIIAALSLMTYLNTVPPAFDQSRDINGNIVPMAFGGEGERHWMVSGYSGPRIPSLIPEKIAAKVTHSGHSPATSRLSYGSHAQAAIRV